MGLRALCGDRLYTSESDVYRRRILTYKYSPRAERVDTTFVRSVHDVGGIVQALGDRFWHTRFHPYNADIFLYDPWRLNFFLNLKSS